MRTKLKVIYIVSSLIFTSFFAFSVTHDYIINRDSNTSLTVSNNITIDFLAPSPSFLQNELLIQEAHISSLYPFIFSNLSFSIDEELFQLRTQFYPQNTDFSGHFFDTNNLIHGSYTLNNESAWIDDIYSSRYNIYVGDFISYQIRGMDYSLRVEAIFNRSVLNPQGVLITQFDENLIEAIFPETQPSFSGVYINSNNINQTLDFLRDYKPYGRLSDTASPQEIEIFENTSFFIEISNIRSTIQSTLSALNTTINESRDNINLKLIIIMVLVFLVSFSDLLLPSTNEEIKSFSRFNKIRILSRARDIYLIILYSLNLLIIFSIQFLYSNNFLTTMLLTTSILLFLFILNSRIFRFMITKISNV